MSRFNILGLLTLLGTFLLVPGAVYAHGFGQRYDLPVPLSYFLAGAAATVAVSFIVIGLFVHRPAAAGDYPRLNLFAVRRLGTGLSSPWTSRAVQGVSVFLFVLVLVSTFIGTDKPIENLSPTFVWIIWWVGMGYVAALVGNVWMLVNPWKILFEWGEALFAGGAGRRGTGMSRYPASWDVWPALVLFLVFAWLENVYAGASEPRKLGLLIVLYSIITWSGMLVYGKHNWLRYGEAFSVLFGIFARFSPTEVRVADRRACRTCEAGCDGDDAGCVNCYECFERADHDRRELNIRPFAVGLAPVRSVSTATAAFVVLALATVTFDGLTATTGWGDFQSSARSAFEVFGGYSTEALETLGLVAAPLVFLAVYLLFSFGMKVFSGEDLSVSDLARTFVFSLVPIALAYNIAHFISLLFISGQLIIPLASDPFGFGWDLFGTADYRVKLTAINAKHVWFVSIGAIVLGHIIAVYLAHVVSIREMSTTARALRSQYPMLTLMVLYTATSLWIIGQPLVFEA